MLAQSVAHRRIAQPKRQHTEKHACHARMHYASHSHLIPFHSTWSASKSNGPGTALSTPSWADTESPRVRRDTDTADEGTSSEAKSAVSARASEMSAGNHERRLPTTTAGRAGAPGASASIARRDGPELPPPAAPPGLPGPSMSNDPCSLGVTCESRGCCEGARERV